MNASAAMRFYVIRCLYYRCLVVYFLEWKSCLHYPGKKVFVLRCLERRLFFLQNVICHFRAFSSHITTNRCLKWQTEGYPLKQQLLNLHVNLNPCHTNEWDNYNYKNLTFPLKQNKNITILKLSLKSWTFDFLTAGELYGWFMSVVELSVGKLSDRRMVRIPWF